jgi:hypothetical protein
MQSYSFVFFMFFSPVNCKFLNKKRARTRMRTRVERSQHRSTKWLLTQPQRASLREGFAFRSGRLAPAAAQRQLTSNGQLFFYF